MRPRGPAVERGAASVWVLAFGCLVLTLAMVASLRATAVLLRHRAEAAADFAALAAAGRIGVDGQVCAAARELAVANGAQLLECLPSLAADGRSGEVVVRLRVRADLPVVGARYAVAVARAGRDPPA